MKLPSAPVLATVALYAAGMYWVLRDTGINGICRRIFGLGFCGDPNRFLIAIGVPLLALLVVYIWKR